MKYFVVSDVHSHFSSLINELNDKGFNENDSDSKVILIGDAFDRGKETLKVYQYLKGLLNKDKLIWIYGNHDIMLLNKLEGGVINDTSLVYKTYMDLKEYREELLNILKNKLVPYFETNHYIFAHGFVPMIKDKINPNWRNLDYKHWFKPCNQNGMKRVMVDGLVLGDKTLVCGHVACSYGNVRKEVDVKDWSNKKYDKEKNNIKKIDNFLPFIGNKVIGIDGYVCKTNHINCLVIED